MLPILPGFRHLCSGTGEVAFDDTWQWHRAADDFHEVAVDVRLAPTGSFAGTPFLVPFSSGMTEWRYTRGGQAGKPMPKGKTRMT